MIRWIRPSGVEIETNETEASIEYAKENNWERAEEPVVEDKKEEPKKPVKAKGVKKSDNSNKDSQ